MTERPSSTAVIITALEVETRAVLRQLGKYDVENVGGTGFFKGRFERWNVVVVEAGAGNAAAAAIAVRALTHYKPDIALFVGVAGSVRDVVIGTWWCHQGLRVRVRQETAKGFQPRACALLHLVRGVLYVGAAACDRLSAFTAPETHSQCDA